jgi:hypothetical protein
MGTQSFAHPTLVFCFSEIALPLRPLTARQPSEATQNSGTALLSGAGGSVTGLVGAGLVGAGLTDAGD